MKIIKKPVITEKSLAAYAKEHKATFEVSLGTNKLIAAKALERIFGVKVLDVKTSSRLGKVKFNRLSKRQSKLSDKKVMIFKLAADSKLDLFEIKKND